jgi:hypothetical protein
MLSRKFSDFEVIFKGAAATKTFASTTKLDVSIVLAAGTGRTTPVLLSFEFLLQWTRKESAR